MQSEVNQEENLNRIICIKSVNAILRFTNFKTINIFLIINNIIKIT